MGKVLSVSAKRLRHVSVSRWGHKGSIENLQQVWYWETERHWIITAYMTRRLTNGEVEWHKN
jgi:hypothetical protein